MHALQLLDHLRKAGVVRMMEDKKEDSPQRGSAVRAHTHGTNGISRNCRSSTVLHAYSSSYLIIALGWVSLGNRLDQRVFAKHSSAASDGWHGSAGSVCCQQFLPNHLLEAAAVGQSGQLRRLSAQFWSACDRKTACSCKTHP